MQPSHKKNPYFTLKRIMNRSKRKKNTRKRASPKEPQDRHASSPSKFLDPFLYHRTLSDLIVFDNPQSSRRLYISTIYYLVNMKHISSIDHFDCFSKVNLEDPRIYPFSPIEMLISRLTSLNLAEAFHLANSLQRYLEYFNAVLKASTQSILIQKCNTENLEEKTVFAKEYLNWVAANSLTEGEFFEYFKSFQMKNPNIPNFCLIYSEFKPYYGMEVKEFLLSNSLKNIMPFSELDFIDEDFLCVETKEYYKIMTEIVLSMHSVEKSITFHCHVKTKLGFKKMIYDVKRMYINHTKGKKVVVHCIFRKDEQLELINKFAEKCDWGKSIVLNNVSFVKKPQKIEKSEKWNQLIDLYFGSFEKFS